MRPWTACLVQTVGTVQLEKKMTAHHFSRWEQIPSVPSFPALPVSPLWALTLASWVRARGAPGGPGLWSPEGVELQARLWGGWGQGKGGL